MGESDHEYQTADIATKYFDPWKEEMWETLFKKYQGNSSPVKE